MAQSGGGRMIVGLDIGTTKVVAIVGEISSEGELSVVGLGSHKSMGLKKVLCNNVFPRAEHRDS